ncbi:MAG TPA: DNA translocase FtsK 4TM domain-containing protein, partial [Aurantimonas sp.]
MATTASGGSETSFLRRQGEIGVGAVMIAIAGYLGVAFATWSVSDPSLSQSNQNMVENWAGPSGAIVADLAMQVFGLGAALLVMLPAIWGLILLSGHAIDHIWRRAWYAVAGTVLAAAALGCLPAPSGWPLPIGLGGVAGDLVLKFPALATGAYPQGFLAIVLALMIAAPAAWLFLNGAGLIDRPRPIPAAGRRRAPVVETDDEDESEGRMALFFGALAHTAYSAKSAIGRGLAARREARASKEFGDGFANWSDEEDLPHHPAQDRGARRSIRVSEPEHMENYYGADADEERAEFDASSTMPWDETEESEARDFVSGDFADDDAMIVGPGDRVSPNAAPIPDEGGGWRGLLSGNIVAFPGRRPARQEEARNDAAHGQTRQDRSGGATSPRLPADPGVRVVPQATVTAEQQRLRSGSGRAVALKPATTVADPVRFELPSVDFLTPPKPRSRDSTLSPEALQENARLLEGVLEDFGVKGEIIEVRPGPVVTLYELEPAPGIKSSRVIGLADDIARSMSAIAARVAVIPGKNAIGIELPNQRRETVYFREMIGSETFTQNKSKLALALGKTIGGEPVIADLAKMPHLLVAGTTGSGKSVAINTMILSLVYRLPPEKCRLIMIDPKMLELSVYDGIPHL